jgi:thiol-disulfide isomerase/thioredoxin
MRTLFLTLFLIALAGSCLIAQDDAATEKSKSKLKAGDAPPALQATQWLVGPEVKSFEKGKVYVVEFWATWCGPCVVMMPHLGDLQEELGPKGVTIVGFTAKDESNTAEKVTEFVKKRGDKLGYSIAYADDRDTYEAFMTAAGKAGIPCSFVIGRDGKIAFIGHPLFLEEVLPKVLAGTWDAEKGAAELEAADKLWDATYAAMTKPGDPTKPLATWEEFHAKWPGIATDPYMNAARLKLLIIAKRYDDAHKLADSIVTKAAKRNDIAAFGNVAAALSADEAIADKDLALLGIKAAESAMAIDGETLPALIRVTKAHAATGNTAKVKEFGPKAVAAAEKALKGDRDVMGTLQLASAHMASGDKEMAKAVAEKAVSLIDEKTEGMRSYIEDQAKKLGAEPKKKDEKKADDKKEQ